jgi:hypothetical protein
LLYTRRLQISPDNKTLTEQTERILANRKTSITTAVHERIKGDAKGLVGTWELRSLRNDTPAYISIEVAGANALKVTNDQFGGGPNSYTVTLGGAEVPVVGAAVIPNTLVSGKQVDDHTIELTTTREGAVGFKSMMRVSADGKTLTMTNTPFGQNGPRGEPTITVFEKH